MSNDNKPIIEWKSFPFVEYPLKSIFLVLFLVFFSFVLWRFTVIKWQMPIFYFLGIIYLFISLITYFIPTRYQLFDDKVVVYYAGIKIEKPYSAFGCFYHDKKSITLSTFKRPRRLDVFRGQMLRFSKSRKEKDDVINFLRTKVDEYNA